MSAASTTRMFEDLMSENLALRLKLALHDPRAATLPGLARPAPRPHAPSPRPAPYAAPARSLSPAGFARDAM